MIIILCLLYLLSISAEDNNSFYKNTSSVFDSSNEPCKGNSHRFKGSWKLFSEEFVPRKSFVCCGGARDGEEDFRRIAENFCNRSEKISDIFMYGHIGKSSQCRDDCCNCDRSDNTRFVPNMREKYFWKPDTCRFQDWDAHLFCSLLGNRTVTLFGDSTTKQAASTLNSMIAAGNGTCGPQIVSMWGHLFTETHHQHKDYSQHFSLIDAVNLTHPDILVINTGAWISEFNDFVHVIDHIGEIFSEIKQNFKNYPKFIWKTQHPGHINCLNFRKPLEWDDVDPNTQGHDRYNWASFRRFDAYVYSRAAELNMSVLDISPLYLRPDMHIYGAHRDCFHACEPGALNIIANAFLQLLVHDEI